MISRCTCAAFAAHSWMNPGVLGTNVTEPSGVASVKASGGLNTSQHHQLQCTSVLTATRPCAEAPITRPTTSLTLWVNGPCGCILNELYLPAAGTAIAIVTRRVSAAKAPQACATHMYPAVHLSACMLEALKHGKRQAAAVCAAVHTA